jgi:hypothetical protein
MHNICLITIYEADPVVWISLVVYITLSVSLVLTMKDIKGIEKVRFYTSLCQEG